MSIKSSSGVRCGDEPVDDEPVDDEPVDDEPVDDADVIAILTPFFVTEP